MFLRPGLYGCYRYTWDPYFYQCHQNFRTYARAYYVEDLSISVQSPTCPRFVLVLRVNCQIDFLAAIAANTTDQFHRSFHSCCRRIVRTFLRCVRSYFLGEKNGVVTRAKRRTSKDRVTSWSSSPNDALYSDLYFVFEPTSPPRTCFIARIVIAKH